MNGQESSRACERGLDSATALAIAKHEGHEPYAITFRYGQRHGVELRGGQEGRRRSGRR